MIYFVVDGIESNLAGIITVEEEVYTFQEQQMNTLDKYLVLLTCALTLMTNTPYHSLKWAFWSIACIGITLLYTFSEVERPLFQFAICLSCIVLGVGVSSIIYDTKCQEKKKQRLTFQMR